jgi:hypothetical protein
MRVKIIVILITAALFTGCDDYLDINTDPNNPTTVPVKGLMSTTSMRTATNIASVGNITSYYVQYLAGPNESGSTDTQQEVSYDGSWAAIYNVLSNVSDMELLAVEQNAPNYVGAAKVMKAINLALLADTWGAAPYSDALFGQNLKPTYDSDQQLYQEIFTLLTDAITSLQSPTTNLTMGNDDFMYQGNVSQWLKTAYALRARYLNHLSKTNSYDPDAVLAALANAYTSNADNAKVNYFETVRNPWGSIAINQAGLILDGWISEQLVDAMNGTTFGVVDPRMPFMYGITEFGTFIGTPNGAGRGGADVQGERSVLVEASYYANRTSPVLVMTYAEQKFIEAEAYMAKDMKPEAYAAYLAGIAAHMDMVGVSAVDRDAYIDDPAVSVGDANITLDLIMKEKYVAMFLHPEAWNDVRRYDFQYTDMTIPANLNPTLNGEFCRRVVYPSTELSRNAANVPDVTMLDRIWWDEN